MAAGGHNVTVTPPGGAALDFSCWVLDADIRLGRDGPDGQPDAASCTLNVIINETTGPLPAEIEIGSTLTVTTYTPGPPVTGHRRYTGFITDIALGWDEAGVATPDEGRAQIICAGVLGALGRFVVGSTSYPQELDGARVARVMAEAGITLSPATSDPGTCQIIARTPEPAPALDIAQATAQSASGILWTTRQGEVRYADAVHRKGTPSSLTLDVCDILVTPTWRRSIEGMVNSVTVTYGDSGSGSYTASDTVSITKYRTFAYSISTLLASAGDASALGQLLMVRNSSPVWVMSELPIDMEHIDAARYAALLDLEMHALITVTGLPTIGGAPTTAQLWVEGWREELSYGTHALALVVSGYCRTAPAPQWDQVDPAWTWGSGPALIEARRNYCTNPAFEVNAAGGWANMIGVPTITRSTVEPYSGTGRLDGAGDGTTTSPRVLWLLTGLVAGDVWTISARIRKFGTWPTGGNTYTLLRFNLAAGGATDSPSIVPFTPDANGWMRVTATGTVPAGTSGTAYCGFGFTAMAGNLTSAGSIGLDEVLVEKTGSMLGYFDGDTADTADTEYAWTGTANASASTQSEFVTLPGGMPATLTWDDTTCLGPPVTFGRWNDQPANLRWNNVPASKTWNNYGG